MSMTLHDALKFSQNPFLSLFLRQIHTSDELFSAIPFHQEGGEAFSYEREVSLGNFNFIAPGGSVAASNSKTERIAVTKREATEDFEIDNFTLDNQSGTVSPVARETAMKAKAAGRAIAGKLFTGASINGITVEGWTCVTALVAASAFITERREPGELRWTNTGDTMAFRAPGDTTFGPEVAMAADGNFTLVSDSPSKWITITFDVDTEPTADEIRRIAFSTSTNEFDSLPRLMNGSQNRASVGTNGDVLSFTILDELSDMVKNQDGMVVYVMPSHLRRKLLSLLRATGANDPPFTMGSGLRVPTFNGYPVLKNDWIPTNEAKGSGTDLSSVYCINLSRGSGLWMGAFGGEQGKFAEAADPREQPVLGFRLREVGQKEGASRGIWRLSWYGTPALGSDLSIARASEIQSA